MLDKQKVIEDLKPLMAALGSKKNSSEAFMKLIGYINKLKQGVK